MDLAGPHHRPRPRRPRARGERCRRARRPGRDRRSASRCARSAARGHPRRRAASTSRSQRISRCSETNPTGQTSTDETPCASSVGEVVEDVRAEPRLARRRLALERERPASPRPAASATRRDVSCSFSTYVSPSLEDPRWERVRREDHVRRLLVQRSAAALRQQRDEPGLAAPLANEAGLDTSGDRVVEELLVLRDRERRPVRREHEADDRVVPELDRRLDRGGDPRLPVAHPGEDGDPELPARGRPVSPR